MKSSALGLALSLSILSGGAIPSLVDRPLFIADTHPASVESWRYARWGMSPREVVAASVGKAVLLADSSARSQAEKQKLKEIARTNGMSAESLMRFKGAASSMESGGIRFQVSFMFDSRTRGLVNVLVYKGLCDQDEATRIRLALDAFYGTPFEDHSFYNLMKSSKWKTKEELIEFGITKDHDSESHSCMISYEPLPKFSDGTAAGAKP